MNCGPASCYDSVRRFRQEGQIDILTDDSARLCDLISGNQRQLEYDFVVAPGADPSRIAWRIDGARASVDAEGNLALSELNGPASSGTGR